LVTAEGVGEPEAEAVAFDEGRPLEGVVVQVVTDVLVRPLVKTNGAGEFRLRKLPLGHWRAIASHEEQDVDEPRVSASREVEVSGPEPVRVDFQLPSGLDVTGQVVDSDGAPVVSASVRFFQGTGLDAVRVGQVETDARGHFALRHLAPGVLDVEVRPPFGVQQPPSDPEEFEFDIIEVDSSSDAPRLRGARTSVRAGDSEVRIVLQPR
jgi:hypothetical protein